MKPPPRQDAGTVTGLPTHLVDVDPEETQEWRESLDEVIDRACPYRARFLMLSLLQRARERAVGVPSLTTTDYITDNAAFFAEPLPGADTPLGSPGGAAKLGRIGADTPLVAGLQEHSR